MWYMLLRSKFEMVKVSHIPTANYRQVAGKFMEKV